jgi:hypothetical protein
MKINKTYLPICDRYWLNTGPFVARAKMSLRIDRKQVKCSLLPSNEKFSISSMVSRSKESTNQPETCNRNLTLHYSSATQLLIRNLLLTYNLNNIILNQVVPVKFLTICFKKSQLYIFVPFL